MYKISIICPVYNSEEYIERTINSIIKQSIGFENLELILVDDYSSDSSRDIIKKYVKKFDNIKLFESNKNHGFPGYGRNVGVEISNSNYIMFIDNDDEYEEDFCEVMYDEIVLNKMDLVCANHKIIKPNETVNIDTFNSISDDKFVKNHDKKKFIELDNFFQLKGNEVWSKIFKKSVIVNNDLKFIEDGILEDVIFLYEYFYYSKRIEYIDYYGYIWHRDGDNLSYYTVKSTLAWINSLYKINNLNIRLYNEIDQDWFVKGFVEGCIFRIILSHENKDDLKLMLNKLYEFEKYMDFNTKLNRYMLNFINRLIMKKRFLSVRVISWGIKKLLNMLYYNKQNLN